MTNLIDTKILSQFPYKVLSESQRSTFEEHILSCTDKVQKNYSLVLKILDAYLYSTEQHLTLKSFNSGSEINRYLLSVIGFIYERLEGSLTHKYNYSTYMIQVFSHVAKKANVAFSPPLLSKVKVHADVQKILDGLSGIDEEKLSFFSDWFLEDNSGSKISVEFSFIREAYGDKVAQQLFSALSRFCRKHKEQTVKTKIKHFKGLFRFFIKLADDFATLKQYLQPSLAVKYLSVIFNIELKSHIDNGLNGRAFVTAWSIKMSIYRECLITYSIFDEPIFPLPVPRFRQAITLSGSHNSSGKSEGKSSGIFNNKLLTKIPLERTDKEAIKEVIKDIRRDIGHVIGISERASDINYSRLRRFEQNAALAAPKELGEVIDYHSIDQKREIACATFNHYLWAHPGKKGGYSTFLGYRDQTEYLNKLLCIPTYHVLYPLLLSLVHEHPKITDSWLLNWRFYDDGGKPLGYVKVKDGWVIRSVKKRRGSENAEQIIPLNDTSKVIVERIVEHTKLARAFLKQQGNNDYQYMLLIASVEKAPAKLKGITNLKKITSSSVFTRGLSLPSPHVSKERAQEVANMLTINRLRSSSGVEVFLKTNSVKKMCEALGHKEERADLVNRYLPLPILKYFKNRWIRIFQNAIVYEAMKDSKHLHKAIDVSPDALEEFLGNHRLNSMHGHVKDGNVFNINDAKPKQDGSIVLSTPLLRILLFFFEATSEEIERLDYVVETINTWEELSTLIITQLEYQLTSNDVTSESFDEEVLDMYKEAKTNPLTISNFRVRG
ncbi:hypothetical protein AB6T38_11015 [Aliiglaciecola sp. SL4]|uniref:hypothetical protein n=1 Tax=Aliiglaciecola sp. SL4 TaxID=3239806 RepID=UPI00355C049B